MDRVWLQTEKPKKQKHRSSEKGQSAVELAFVVPILIVLLLAVADFGRVFLISVAVNNAARAGAQYGSQTVSTAQDTNGIETAAATDFGCVASGGNTCPDLTRLDHADRDHVHLRAPLWDCLGVSNIWCGHVLQGLVGAGVVCNG